MRTIIFFQDPEIQVDVARDNSVIVEPEDAGGIIDEAAYMVELVDVKNIVRNFSRIFYDRVNFLT